METQKDTNRTYKDEWGSDKDKAGLELYSSVLFVHRKTERVVAALFLITENLGADNPIRHKVRNLGVDLMSFMLAETRSKSDQFDRSGSSFVSRLLEIASLLEIAFLAEQLSEMNVRLLGSEIERLVLMTEKNKRQNESSSMQVSNVNKVLSAEDSKERSLGLSHKIRQRLFDKRPGSKASRPDPKYSSAFDVKKPQQLVFKDNKNERRKVIVEALQGGKKMGVKDFVSVLYGVGEKTIQRELAALVESGVLNREGERRWSKYSLSDKPKTGPEHISP